jgi:hypothetical protein
MVQTHEVWDLSPWLTAGEDFYLEWYYRNLSATDIAFWGIDDVRVYDSNGDLLGSETFDEWLPDGWQDPLAPSGNPVAACDGRDYSSFDTSLYSPLIYDITDTAVTVDFYSSFECEDLYNYAEFCVWHGDIGMGEFADDFESDLSLWTVVDEGSGNLNVSPSSVGSIKASYR